MKKREDFFNVFRKTLLTRFIDLIEENQSYDWAGYYIDQEAGNYTFSVSTDYQRVEFLLTRESAMYVTLSEESHHDVVVRLAKPYAEAGVQRRTVRELMKDVNLLLKIFYSGDFHHFMYVANMYAPDEQPSLDFEGAYAWREVYRTYREMGGMCVE